MSGQGANNAAAAVALEAHSGTENESVILGDSTLSQGSSSLEQAVAQSHERSKSSSNSVYTGASDTGESYRNVADESGIQSQSVVASEDGGVQLKGKEPNNIALEEAQEDLGAEDSLASLVQLSPESGRIQKVVDESAARMAQFTGRERPMQPLSGGNSRGSYYSEPDPQPNRQLTGSDLVRSAFGEPPTRQPPFGAHGNSEEDRKNWERVQSIAGPSTAQYHYNPRQIDFTNPSNPSSESPSRVAQKRKSSSNDEVRSLDGMEPSPSSAHSGYLRPPPYDENSSSGRNTSQLPCTHPSLSRQNSERRARPDIVIPRWQPDAEVTLCPICGTQFSFFVRKHHCRKCGRVVCAACSPHRITIPYQFIVQPPTESEALGPALSRARPALDPARTGSSEFESLGGGERVRLCNPCVPDPNTAPPQTPIFATQPQSTPQRNTHSRSASSTTSYTTPSQPSLSSSNPSERPSGFPYNYRQRARQPSILGRQPSDPANSSGSRPSFATRPTISGASQNPAYGDYRMRSSTVSGGAVRQDSNSPRPVPAPAPGAYTNRGPPTLVPRAEHQTRPLPRVPRPPRIAEEDECPICHQELPSSQLPNAEDLRAAHITNCIENAMQGSSTTSPGPQIASSNIPPQASPSVPSSSTALAPIPNTPEARMAAREQAHAAVVLGQRSSPSPAYRPTGVFPYKATEKDCVDDAECTICLEEFEVGQDMGRLECFCRFHLHCIREWFVNHYGQCPVHHQAY